MQCLGLCTKKSPVITRESNYIPKNPSILQNNYFNKTDNNELPRASSEKFEHLQNSKTMKFKEQNFSVYKKAGMNESPRKTKLFDQKTFDSMNKPLYEFQDKFMCMLCGGKSCKHENWKLHPNPAIRGLNSDQITNDLFASQRLSTRLIHEFNLIDAFHKLEIGLIVNLQLQGEHPYCGDKLDIVSGFSYDPQILISENIKCKNPGWKDMSIPDSLHFMLNIVKDMGVVIKDEKKKVLVHCHAGYGRTGCVLICYMIYDSNDTLQNLVQQLRDRRKGCIQKNSQMDFCKRFYEYVHRARIIFTPHNFPIDYYMKNQSDLLFGEEFKRYEHIPKLIGKAFERIIEIQRVNAIENIEIYKNFYFLSEWSDGLEEELLLYKREINIGNWEIFSKIEKIPSLVLLIFDWLEDCVENLISPEKIFFLFSNKIKEEEIISIIQNFRGTETAERKSMCNSIKKNIRRLEFEIINCLSDFLMEFPFDEDDEESKFYFERMREKLILTFTGISLTTINYQHFKNMKEYNNDCFPNEIRTLIIYFTYILDFFELIKKNDVGNNNLSFFIGGLNDSILSSKHFSEIDGSIIRSKQTSFLNPEFRDSIKKQDSFKLFDDKIQVLDENDKFMLSIKESINQYFNEKFKKNKNPSTQGFFSKNTSNLTVQNTKNRSSKKLDLKGIFGKLKDYIYKDGSKAKEVEGKSERKSMNNIVINKNLNQNYTITLNGKMESKRSGSVNLSPNLGKSSTKYEKKLPTIDENMKELMRSIEMKPIKLNIDELKEIDEKNFQLINENSELNQKNHSNFKRRQNKAQTTKMKFDSRKLNQYKIVNNEKNIQPQDEKKRVSFNIQKSEGSNDTINEAMNIKRKKRSVHTVLIKNDIFK